MVSETCLTCSSMAAPLSQVGTMMAEFPLDPQLAKMMVTAPEYRSAFLQRTSAIPSPQGYSSSWGLTQ